MSSPNDNTDAVAPEAQPSAAPTTSDVGPPTMDPTTSNAATTEAAAASFASLSMAPAANEFAALLTARSPRFVATTTPTAMATTTAATMAPTTSQAATTASARPTTETTVTNTANGFNFLAALPFFGGPAPVAILPGTGSPGETKEQMTERFKAAHQQLSAWAGRQSPAPSNDEMLRLRGMLNDVTRLNVDTSGLVLTDSVLVQLYEGRPAKPLAISDGAAATKRAMVAKARLVAALTPAPAPAPAPKQVPASEVVDDNDVVMSEAYDDNTSTSSDPP